MSPSSPTAPPKKITRRRPRALLGTRGGAMIEYILLVGVVALLAISGFRQARQRENLVVARQAAAVAALETPPSGFVQVGDYLCTDTYCVPGSGMCFGAGTPVLTEDGLRPIESIREGDRVWSRDEHTGATELRAVLKRFVTPAQPAISLSVAARDGGELLRVTSGHPFWVTGQGWVPAVELTADQSLWSPSGEPLHVAPRDSFETSYETVYNFEVADFHTYFVGRHALLVHNAGPNDPNGPGGPCQNPGNAATPPPLRYEASPKHPVGVAPRPGVAPGPSDGQGALESSVSAGPNTTRRVGIDYTTGEYVVFDETFPGSGIFHGHTRTWDQVDPRIQPLDNKMKAALVKAKMANLKGKILPRPAP